MMTTALSGVNIPLTTKYVLRALLSTGRVHHETRHVRFPPEHVFSVVSNVARYSKFVPWCTGSRIQKGPNAIRDSEGRVTEINLDAQLAIGFQFLSEKYTSRVKMFPYRYIEAVSRDTTVFDKLVTKWKFSPGRDLNSCQIDFFIEFQFRNALYGEASSLFFDEVVQEMVNAFDKECLRVERSANRGLSRAARRQQKKPLRIDKVEGAECQDKDIGS